MAALLNATPKYKDPRANILYGSGNKTISDADIKAFISVPGRTAADIEGAALKYGVSAGQISNAMKGNAGYSEDNINKYLTEQGISKEEVQPVPQVTMPSQVAPNPISVGSNETVEGRIGGILKDPNNPLNVQAQTFGNQQANRRGLLNSSIGISAAQDAMYKNAMPIAQQDAATFYDAQKTNVGNKLNADIFNSDMQGRVGMFNAGTSKDIMLQREGNDLNRYIADMDAGNKIAIANIQAMANDSGIMGDLGKSMMSLYQQTAADPNIAPEVKQQIFSNLKDQFESISSLLPSFQRIGSELNFGSSGSATSTGSNSINSSGEVGAQSGDAWDNTASTNNNFNPLGYSVEPYVEGNVLAYERETGQKIDRSKVAPEQLVMDIKSIGQGPTSYLSADGTVKVANNNAYDLAGLMSKYKASSVGDLFNKMFAPVHPPGTMRADSPLFYVYR